MPRLTAIEVRGYRSFPSARLELRPLTLLYGRNNAGKSSLLRLLPILAASVAEDAVLPWDLRHPAARGATFDDLRPTWQRGRKSFWLVLHWDEDPAIVDELEIYYDDDRAQPRVAEIRVRRGPSTVVEATAEAYPDERTFSVRTEGGASEMLPLHFAGLVPQAPCPPPIADLAARLRGLRRSVQWLESVRQRPERYVEQRGAAPARLEPDGGGALDVLLAEAEVLDGVRQWYARSAIGRRLEMDLVNRSLYRPCLSLEGAGRVPLTDTGEGMGQVLPVLVAAEMLRRQAGPRFLAVEGPEAQLHPDAERELATYLWELASSDQPPIIVAETHSRTLLLGLQRAAAQAGREDLARRVGVWWVSQGVGGRSELVPIELTGTGALRGWPRSAMAEDLALARELQNLQITG